MRWLLAVFVLLAACGDESPAPRPAPISAPLAPPQDLATTEDMSTAPDLAKDPGVAPACRSCSQSDPGACGGVPSVCGCYPGPACCCR